MQFFSKQTCINNTSVYHRRMGQLGYLVFLIAIMVASYVEAEIHKWVDENGKVHYGDKPPEQLKGSQQPNSSPRHKATTKRPAITRLDSVSGGAQNSVVLRIRNHFFRQEYRTVEKILRQLQIRADKDISNEPELFSSLKAFELNDNQYLPLFDTWINQSPNNYFAHLAKARFLFRFGWKARGGRWSSATPQDKFDTMKDYFAEAKANLERAQSLNPASLLPYSMYISMANATGDAKSEQRFLEAGLKLAPSSYELRKTYIHSIKPRWGGSLEKMRIFADNAQYYSVANPLLKRLLGEALAESGVLAYSKKQYKKADRLFNKALLYAEDPETYFKRAKARYRLTKYSKAISDLNMAIRLNPDTADYYKWRYFSFAKAAKFDKALHDIKRAALLDPSDRSINDLLLKTLTQANAQGSKQKTISALDSKLFEFDSQIKAQPNNAYHYYRKGHYLLSSNLFSKSEKPLRHAIRLAPNQFDYYQALDLALFKQGKLSDIIEFWEQYLALEPNDGRAYLERAGTFYHMQNYQLAKIDARKALDLGIKEAKPLYKRLMNLSN